MNYRALFCKKKSSLFSSLRSVDSTHIRRGEIRPSKRPLKPFSPLFPSCHRASEVHPKIARTRFLVFLPSASSPSTISRNPDFKFRFSSSFISPIRFSNFEEIYGLFSLIFEESEEIQGDFWLSLEFLEKRKRFPPFCFSNRLVLLKFE